MLGWLGVAAERTRALCIEAFNDHENYFLRDDTVRIWLRKVVVDKIKIDPRAIEYIVSVSAVGTAMGYSTGLYPSCRLRVSAL